MNIGYFEAWWSWCSGEEVRNFYLYGLVKILLLGRIGKILEFFGVVLPVIELIGAGKLELAAETWSKRSIKVDIKRWLSKSKIKMWLSKSKSRRVTFFIWAGIVSFLVLSSIVISTNEYFNYNPMWTGAPEDITQEGSTHPVIFIFILSLIFFYGVVDLFLSMLFRSLAFIAAFLSNKPRLVIIVVFLGVVGYHFDLLAS
jgi:hypothetical protein